MDIQRNDLYPYNTKIDSIEMNQRQTDVGWSHSVITYAFDELKLDMKSYYPNAFLEHSFSMHFSEKRP